MERAKAFTICLIMQWFLLIRVRLRRLDNYKFVHNTGKFMQPQFEQFQLVEKSEAIVNHRGEREINEALWLCQVENKTFTFRRRRQNGGT